MLGIMHRFTPRRDFLLLLAIATGLQTGSALAACDVSKADVKGNWGKASFTIELADDEEERAIGLMNRESMPRMSGMLFIYEKVQPLRFWMRNTLIPLDMIFLDETGTVTHVHENAVPLDETVIDGGTGVATLEINGGMSRRLGIAPGTVLRHPGLDQAKAAWPCS